MTERDVFISHSSGDAEVARALRGVLETAGYSCWMAPDDVVGTETWTEQILGAIADSKAMIVLVSTAANRSAHVSREVNLALGRSRAVLPIRIESVAPEGSLEYLLSLVQRIDAYPPPITDHQDRILRRLAGIIERADRPAAAGGQEAGSARAGGAAPVEDETELHATAGLAAITPAKGPRARRGAAAKAAGGAAKAGEPKAEPKVRQPAAPSTETVVPASPAVPREPLPPPPAIKLPPPIAEADTTVPPAPPPKSPAARRRRGQPIDIGPGTVIGGFTVESTLGEGGMATVYRARQEEPRRLVALKVIRADHAADETYRMRFLTEKETLAALEHPIIVPIYAAGEDNGVLYIAMRLVDGPDLQSKITRQGRLSLRETVQILEPIADAVDYAHSTGVIHRDLKPSNIILDRAGRPYLTDFGLGKRLEVNTSVSVPGMAIGTLDFMAPEQFTGQSDPELAPAIDLYALGCVAYSCLTGQPPFVRPTPQQLMYAHANETPPPIRSLRPEYPPVIDEIFNRVLAKDPAARYGSAREFVSALESIVQSASAGLTSPVVIAQSVSPAAQARKWVGRNTQLAVGAGAIALVLAVVFLASKIFGPPGPSPQPTQGAVITLRPSTPQPATAPPVTIPPVTAPPVTAPPVSAGPNGFPNEREATLLAALPATVDITKCTRVEDKYETATAMVFCPAPPGSTRVVFFALYPDAPTMTENYDAIMSNTTVADGTETGCFTLVTSNNGWSYTTGGVAGPQAGFLGCYPRTEGDVDGIQYVWTHDKLRVMGLWLSPGYQEGLDYFNAWAVGVEH